MGIRTQQQVGIGYIAETIISVHYWEMIRPKNNSQASTLHSNQLCQANNATISRDKGLARAQAFQVYHEIIFEKVQTQPPTLPYIKFSTDAYQNRGARAAGSVTSIAVTSPTIRPQACASHDQEAAHITHSE